MKKHKESRKEEQALLPKNQVSRLKKLFSIYSGKNANRVDLGRLN